MTNPGLYADLHQQMREIAELVDKVLVNLKGPNDNPDANRESLASILDHLAEPNPEDLTDRLLSITLRSGRNNYNEEWKQISKALRASDSDARDILRLEQFAQLLEQRQADALAKMRGWTR